MNLGRCGCLRELLASPLLLFCVHPVHVEAVASLVGRADSLCGLFYILAILCYVQSVGGGRMFSE